VTSRSSCKTGAANVRLIIENEFVALTIAACRGLD
jgi:hypothetical protein